MYDESKVEKFIVFKIAYYQIALLINDVLKVVNCSSIPNQEILTLGLAHIGRHTIRVLDLHDYLNGKIQNPISLQISKQISNLSQKNTTEGFLVIVRNLERQFCGILVDQPPDLLELPDEMMRSLPKSARQPKTLLDLVSHVAVVSRDGVTNTIFLLDVEQVLNLAINDSHSLALKESHT
ncbi:MAG: chemotaxis protein CheW [Rhizonema sp. PD38]|nr:chemotaxis protein CheW [Rhizonema sp. PD38]